MELVLVTVAEEMSPNPAPDAEVQPAPVNFSPFRLCDYFLNRRAIAGSWGMQRMKKAGYGTLVMLSFPIILLQIYELPRHTFLHFLVLTSRV